MPDNLRSMIKTADIFSSLDELECGLICDIMTTSEIPPETYICRQKDPGEHLYIVLDGSIEIFVEVDDGTHVPLATLGKGDFFGEMSIFEDAERSASCKTIDTVLLAQLHKDDFFKFTGVYPATAIKIMYRMLEINTKRHGETSSMLSNLVRWGETAQKRAITDDLTGLYNRRYLDDALEQHFTRAKIESTPLCVIMLDLDHFREINEAYGHEVGDSVIKVAASVFREVFSSTDILARYGGDEFTFVLPGIDPKKALALAGEVCAKMRQVDLLRDRDGPIRSITTSQGVAGYPVHARTIETLKSRADEALYKAKDSGRDCANMYTKKQ